MVDTGLEDTGGTMASERPRLSLTTDTEDTEATVEDMVVTVLATGGATTASVRLRPSPTMAMEDMVDTVLEDTEATEATVMAMASNMFHNRSNVSYFAQP